ncbi:hypothetical protein HUB98_05805 [Paenibacillus barcinonensis]|uniref:Uncharacterized protein n=1 Tax=Paenibacillus barcinonensis TaxID=198119 RepID=A0A2V4VD58_PAEBA|nr:hypothetical protein [Paenibacillus barcinonensis]PYE51512.1 hypothetical protein DFQ00_102306 [Paenibacillus barcinonensis]QKS55895.1 hypothetical protein HUB98_05805 [Paenibacillus barcinonensis]
MLRDYNDKVIHMGATARPVMGHLANYEGVVVEIDKTGGFVSLKFEDGEIGVYFNDRIIVF